jgi:hypothetical protein
VATTSTKSLMIGYQLMVWSLFEIYQQRKLSIFPTLQFLNRARINKKGRNPKRWKPTERPMLLCINGLVCSPL